MKTRIIAVITLAAVVAAACTKENVSAYSPETECDLTFAAGFETTRTNLAQDAGGAYTKMEWSAGDRIGVFDGSGVPQPFVTTESGASVSFTGKADAPEGNWLAFYPYNPKATLSSTGKSLITSIPEVQFARKDGVADNVTLLVASCEADSRKFVFTQVCGLIRLELPSGCVSVTIENPANEKMDDNGGLTGVIGTTFGKNTAYSAGFSYSSVTLLSPDGKGLEAGNYYVAVRPVKYTGKLLLTVRREDGHLFITEKEVSDLSVGRGQILPVKINPEWTEDDGVALYTGGTADRFAPQTNVKTSSVTISDDERLMGRPTVRFELTSEAAWSGALIVKGDPIDVTPYGGGNYAIEYYVKCEDSALGVEGYDELFYNLIGKNNDKYYPFYRRTSGHTDRLYRGVADTLWHRMTFPLTPEMYAKVAPGGSMSKVAVGLNAKSADVSKAYKGSVMYFSNFRIVRKSGR